MIIVGWRDFILLGIIAATIYALYDRIFRLTENGIVNNNTSVNITKRVLMLCVT
jgi:hypothetical protein